LTLNVVPVSGGLARLGSWGTLVLTGARSALLRLTWTEDIELPEAVSAEIPGGVLLLSDEPGRLLFLPYAGELVVAYDLKQGEPVYPLVSIPRNPDRGLRMAVVRVFPDLGAIFLTEATLACFREDCTIAWRHDEDFAGWTIEGITLQGLHLIAGDWAGREQCQTRSLVDGNRLD